MTLVQVHDNHCDIVGDDAPPDPAFEARQAMIETARQTPCAPQVTNAAFNPVTEALRGPEPGLPLAPMPAFRLAARLGQTDAAHTHGPRGAFVLRRIDAPI